MDKGLKAKSVQTNNSKGRSLQTQTNFKRCSKQTQTKLENVGDQTGRQGDFIKSGRANSNSSNKNSGGRGGSGSSRGNSLMAKVDLGQVADANRAATIAATANCNTHKKGAGNKADRIITNFDAKISTNTARQCDINVSSQVENMQNAPTQQKQKERQQTLARRQQQQQQKLSKLSPASQNNHVHHSASARATTGDQQQFQAGSCKLPGKIPSQEAADQTVGCPLAVESESCKDKRHNLEATFRLSLDLTDELLALTEEKTGANKRDIIYMKNSAFEYAAKASLMLEAQPFRMPNS